MTEIIEIYQQHLPDIRKAFGDEWKAICPFHEENTASFFVNEKTGLFYCYGCGKSGNLAKFCELFGIEKIEVHTEKSQIDLSIVKPISPKLISQYHQNLLNNSYKLAFLLRERKLSLFIIKKYLIGFDTSSGRFSIPIKSSTGEFINIKLHHSHLVPKSYYFQRGHPKLYPISSLQKTSIVICEGELDCLALLSVGINAISPTSGANTWLSKWNSKFKDKDVKILYDSDIAGTNGAKIVKSELENIANKVEIILFDTKTIERVNSILERNLSSKIDITDYLLAGLNAYELLRIRRKI